MLAESSNNPPIQAKDAPVTTEFAWPGRILLLALNFIPLAHLALIVWVGVTFGITWAFLFLYLAPPLIARVILAFSTFQDHTIHIGSRAFFQWWTLFQL